MVVDNFDKTGIRLNKKPYVLHVKISQLTDAYVMCT